MHDPTLWSRIWDFGASLLPYWWALLAGGVFAVEPMIEPLLGRRCKDCLDKYLPKERRHSWLRWLSIAAIFVANFLVYDDVSKKSREIENEAHNKIEAAETARDSAVKSLNDLQASVIKDSARNANAKSSAALPTPFALFSMGDNPGPVMIANNFIGNLCGASILSAGNNAKGVTAVNNVISDACSVPQSVDQTALLLSMWVRGNELTHPRIYKTHEPKKESDGTYSTTFNVDVYEQYGQLDIGLRAPFMLGFEIQHEGKIIESKAIVRQGFAFRSLGSAIGRYEVIVKQTKPIDGVEVHTEYAP
jgi:hypothetical protein